MLENRVNKKLQDVFSPYQPVAAEYDVVNVNLNPSELLATLARETAAEIERLVPFAGHPILTILSEERILNYFNTLIYWRVSYVNNDSVVTRTYKPAVKTVAIPILFYQILISIGIAHDRDYGITFNPAYSKEGKAILSLQQVQETTQALIASRNFGFKLVEGMPRELEGELGFMAMSCVEDEMRSYRKDHPVYAFLASFFAQQQWQEALDLRLRVRYGYASEFAAMLTSVLQLMKDAPPARKTDDSKP